MVTKKRVAPKCITLSGCTDSYRDETYLGFEIAFDKLRLTFEINLRQLLLFVSEINSL